MHVITEGVERLVGVYMHVITEGWRDGEGWRICEVLLSVFV